MTNYLSKTEFEALQQRLLAGNAGLTISKQVARQFFNRVANKAVVSITGESVLLKKLVLFSLYGASISLFLASLGLVFIEFEWGAALAIPALGIFWSILTVLTSDKGSHWIGHGGLLLSLAPIALLPGAYSYPIALVGMSIWIHRFIFSLSQFWLEQLVTNSYDAFDMMAEHIEIEDSQQSIPDEQLP